MIIYNKEWLNNLHIVDLLKADQQANRITTAEFDNIKTAHPVGFYIPGIIVRVGLFILTLIIALFATGLLSLLGLSTHLVDSPGWPIFLGIVCYAALEYLMRERHYFHSGVDNALLYYSACLFAGGCIWLIIDMHLNSVDTLLCAALICILCTLLTFRFADVVTTAASCIAFFAFVYFAWAKAGQFGLATMPFIMMMAAGGAYFFFNRISSNKASVNYTNCLIIAKIISLITLYAAGNYFVVNRLNNALNGLDDSHTTIPFGYIFWLWTILLPVVYVFIGIKKKNTMFLRIGMILAAVSVATFRNYYHLLPIEIMLTLSGMILLALSYTIIKYLKIPRIGFTYAEPDETGTLDSLNIEGLVIGETTSHLPPAANLPTQRFGGGTGGGGGSSGDF
ncbi:hypothetical protein [Mucilaginibacter sp.]|uniref:hypothetical protein n=1 Tax=Mucilaginibacter sp. TaxID=1882438 RepID=UPI002638D163|nr:hypothetical protein [Mucilaginibacter sp.]MDB5128493.1 hypothetical protein [Mucilaginibacter sp.]